MQVTVSRVTPVVVELTVAIAAEQIGPALQRAYSEVAKTAQLKGFRKGKVPQQLLRQYYGQRVVTDVFQKLVDDTLNKAIGDEKLEPVTRPEIEPVGMLDEAAAWTYRAKFEVRPTIGEIDMAVNVEKHVYSVTEADVDAEIERLRERHSTLVAPDPARPVVIGDHVTLDYDVALDGTVRSDLESRNRTVEVGRGRLLTELDEGVIGMALNEPKTIKVHFGPEHPREDLRDKDAEVTVTVRELREKILPAVDDELAKDAGSDSLEALKAKIRGEIEAEGAELTATRLREDAVLALVEKNPVDAPPALVEQATSVVAREMLQQIRMGGAPFDAANIVENARVRAEQRVRAGLLLTELARRESLTISEQDLEQRLEALSKETGKAVARLRAEYRDAQKRETLAAGILEDKVLAVLLGKINVTEVAANEPVRPAAAV